MWARDDPGPLLRFAPFQHTTHVYSPSELAQHIAGILEADRSLRDVWLRGEVTNLSRSPAGHLYFSLKDDLTQLRCVLFRGNAFNSPVSPANGLALVAHGAIRFYDRLGTCELVADLLFPEGVGLAQMQFEALYRRLQAEGLFEPSHKRSLPDLPRRIGIVSSEKGAAIHDILTVLGRRYPLAEVVFAPAPVQGLGAAEALVRAFVRLRHWQRQGRGVDVIVLARGGGSEEDLAAFNDEALVRAAFSSPVPVVSAVGHATNETLCDLVADIRAPTPSAAAEMITPDVAALRRELLALRARGRQAALEQLDRARVATESAKLQLTRHMRQRLRFGSEQLEARAAQLRALSPAGTLSRGYAIATLDGHVLRDASSVTIGAEVVVQLRHGQLVSTVEAVEPTATQA
jgi:exodeoxyribonuclease VII large subunit